MEAAFRAWWQESYGLPPGPHAVMTHVAWGEHLLARRPKQPSLKAQALEALEVEDDSMPLRSLERSERFDTIRRALEALDD
jgi:hypothetical protein